MNGDRLSEVCPLDRSIRYVWHHFLFLQFFLLAVFVLYKSGFLCQYFCGKCFDIIFFLWIFFSQCKKGVGVGTVNGLHSCFYILSIGFRMCQHKSLWKFHFNFNFYKKNLRKCFIKYMYRMLVTQYLVQ